MLGMRLNKIAHWNKLTDNVAFKLCTLRTLCYKNISYNVKEISGSVETLLQETHILYTQTLPNIFATKAFYKVFFNKTSFKAEGNRNIL